MTGDTPDLSPMLLYAFNQPVMYVDEDSSYPDTTEEAGRWFGVAENMGFVMTFWILTANDTVIARSNVRPIDGDNPNM